MTTTITDPAAALSTGELETELLGLAGNLAAAQCRFLQLLAEFDERGGWAGPGLKSCAHWLCWRIGMSLRTAAEHVRVAHALTRLPKITEAFAAGRLSYSKVRAVTRLVGQPTAAPPGGSAPERLAGADPTDRDPAGADPQPDPHPADPHPADPHPADPNGADSHRADPDGAEPHEPDPHRADPDGAEPHRADPHQPEPHQRPEPVTEDPTDGLPEVPRLADDAEQVLLDLALAGTASHVETVVRATRRAQADPNRATALRSLSWHHAEDGSLILRGRFTPDEGAQLVAAIEALVAPRRPVTHPVPAAPEGWRDLGREQAPGAVDERIAARRADALLTLVTDPTDRDETAGARQRAHVIVHIEAATGAARIEGGPQIPATTAQRIACDADVQVLLQDTTSNRLYLSRRRRLATPAQIAALTVRDGPGCRFPGCSHTRHLRAHHIRHWLHDGPTDLDNLVLVCGFHHRLVHDNGYGIRWVDRRWLFSRPDGTPVPETGAPLEGNTESLIELNTRAELRITRDSLTPFWEGERLDPDPILRRLLPPRRQPAA